MPFGDFSILNQSITEIHISDLTAWCNMSVDGQPALPGGKLYLNENEIVNFVIPDTVTSIRDYAFGGISSIKTVAMHDNVTSIGVGAFKVYWKIRI